ncbi:MAG: hypothetical protein EBY80_13565, partial [Actinobacteria bacterium]|nr:hypothetical protein [Actinomycetota bacterium]
MSARNKILAGVSAILVVLLAVVVGRSVGGGGGSDSTLLITPRLVERRDLKDVLTVSGEVRRDET